MGYVIAAILVLLIVAAGVTFFVLSAARKDRRSAAADSSHGEGKLGSETAIVAPDENTPLGDTDQHAEPAEGHGGVTAPGRGSTPPGGTGGIGGEAEGGRPVTPESERLADRGR